MSPSIRHQPPPQKNPGVSIACRHGAGLVQLPYHSSQCPAASLSRRRLYLNDNGVTRDSAGSINLALREGSLAGLHIKLNKELGDATAEALELSKADTLQTLDVSQCGLTWAGATLLLGPSELSTLSLFGNQLADGLDAALELPTLFTRATKLTDLDLSGNSLGDAGAFKVLDRLQTAEDQLPALAIIGLGANDCADKGEWHNKVQDFRMARQTVRVAWE